MFSESSVRLVELVCITLHNLSCGSTDDRQTAPTVSVSEQTPEGATVRTQHSELLPRNTNKKRFLSLKVVELLRLISKLARIALSMNNQALKLRNRSSHRGNQGNQDISGTPEVNDTIADLATQTTQVVRSACEFLTTRQEMKNFKSGSIENI